MRRSRRRLAFAVIVAAAPVLGTMALAQPRAKPPASKPKPPPTATPSAAPATQKAPAAAAPDAQAAFVEDAAADAQASAHEQGAAPPAEANDGGARPSPLNPEPEEMPQVLADAGVPVDYERLLADIAALRARVAAVADNLYRSRIAIAVELEGSHAKLARLAISLDEGVVYTAPPTFAAAEMTRVYDHALAPGRHAITIDVDRKDDRDEAFRTSQRTRFLVDVPRDHKLVVEVRIIDDSGIAGDWASDRSGRYDLRFRVKAAAKPVGP